MWRSNEEKRYITFEEFAALGVTKDMLYCLWQARGGKYPNKFLTTTDMGYYYDDTDLLVGRHLVVILAGVRVIDRPSVRLDDADALATVTNIIKANAVWCDLLVKSHMNLLFTIAVDLGWSKLSFTELGLDYDNHNKFVLLHANDLAHRVRPEQCYELNRLNLMNVAPKQLGTVVLSLAETIKDRMAIIYDSEPAAVDQWLVLIPFPGGMRGEITTTCGDFSHTLVFNNPDLIDINTGSATAQLDYLMQNIRSR